MNTESLKKSDKEIMDEIVDEQADGPMLKAKPMVYLHYMKLLEKWIADNETIEDAPEGAYGITPDEAEDNVHWAKSVQAGINYVLGLMTDKDRPHLLMGRSVDNDAQMFHNNAYDQFYKP